MRHSGRFAKADAGLWRTAPCHEHELPIAQLRWDPAPIPKQDMTFLQGVQTMTTAGDVNTQAGIDLGKTPGMLHRRPDPVQP